MKDFLKTLLASLIALALFAGGGFVILLILISAAAADETPGVPSKAVLVIDLSKPISDKPVSPDPGQIFQQALVGDLPETQTLRSLVGSLRSAADDDRIAAVLVKGPVMQSSYQSGWAALRELRNELLEFRNSGKELHFYSMAMADPGYYVATATNHIHLHPMGALEINGLASEMMYFARALNKYGIDMQVVRVGKFKAAVEPFMLDHMSPESRQQITAFLTAISDEYVSAVCGSRGMPENRLAAYMNDKAVLNADEARELNLIDSVSYFDSVRKHLRGAAPSKRDENDFSRIKASDYWEAVAGRGAGRSQNRIAVIYAEGEIIPGDSKSQVGGQHVASLLRKARENEDVKAVVMRVNSPGGSAAASEVIQRETRLLQEAGKPFVVSMGSVAASGGYWIAAYADEIIAQPNTITGSIGVFGILPSFGKLAEDFGVTTDTVKTHRFADLNTIMRSKSEEELEIVQGFVDRVYDQFLTRVSEGRKIDREKVHEIAQGRVWSGVEAKRLKLVDSLGGMDEAVASAADRAGLGEDYRLLFYQRKKNLSEAILEMLEESNATAPAPGPAEMQLRRIAKTIRYLRSLDESGGVQARLEFDLFIR